MPDNSTSFVMTNLQDKTHQIKKILGNLYGLRTWVEYGFRQCKQELGWTDYRFTRFKEIEKWWELIFSAYLMVSLTAQAFLDLESNNRNCQVEKAALNIAKHQQWNQNNSWKNCLNNLRLIIQPTMLLWLISPWLDIFPNRSLLPGFQNLIPVVSQFLPYYSSA